MRLRILSWSYLNIRGMNNLEILLTDNGGKPYPIALFMMANGTGKTTTMALLGAAFSGSASEWTPSFVKEFKPPSKDLAKGEFRVRFVLDNDLYLVEIILNYNSGKAFYRTSRSESGYDDGLRLPETVKRVFSKEFVDRFIFDGELAKDILKLGKDEAEKALKNLYQINYVSALGKVAIDQVDEVQKSLYPTTNARTDHAVTRIRQDKEEQEKILNELKQREIKLKRELKEKKDRRDQIEEDKSRQLKSDQTIREQVQININKRTGVDGKIKEVRQKVLGVIRSPHLFSKTTFERMNYLASKMNQLQLPENLSRQFFEELAEAQECVCGRPIGPHEHDSILNGSTRYLGSDEIGVINEMKSAIKDNQYTPELKDDINKLNDLLIERNSLEREWGVIEGQKSDDNAYNELLKEEKELELSIQRISDQLNELTTKDRLEQERKALSDKGNIPLCENVLADKERKLNDVTGTVTLLKKAKVVQSYLKEIEYQALSLLKEKIVENTNYKIQWLLPFEKITVERIDGHLTLLRKAGASQGQSLAIAYAYLGTLFSESAYNFPFVVDSPAGALDLQVRRNVSTILPKLFDQLIVFITSGEREAFADVFYKLDGVQYFTIVPENNNVIIVREKDAFYTFQSEDDTINTL